jgi:outer membrane protein
MTPNIMKICRQFALSAAVLALGAGAAQAQKFAIIDMQRALLATSEGKKAAAAIDAKFSPVKAELDQLQKDIIQKQDAFTKGRTTMSPTALAAAQAQIESLTTLMKRKQEDAQQDLQAEENKQLGGIMPKLQQVITAYATLNQLTFVVDTSANPNNLVYADASINITAAVVAAFEKANGAPAAPAPATAAPKTPAAAAPKPAAPAAPKAATPAK